MQHTLVCFFIFIKGGVIFGLTRTYGDESKGLRITPVCRSSVEVFCVTPGNFVDQDSAANQIIICNQFQSFRNPNPNRS